MITKSKEMLDIERKSGKPIEQAIADTFAEHPSIYDTAKVLGVSYATLRRWIRLCNLEMVRPWQIRPRQEPPSDETEVVGGSPVVLE